MTGSTTVIIAMGCLVAFTTVIAIVLNRTVKLKFGVVEATVKRTEQKVAQIDKAVNNVPPGYPTLYDQAKKAADHAGQVAECRKILESLPTKVERIATVTLATKETLDKHLVWHGGDGHDEH